MNGRLSNSALLREIIPKVKDSIDGPKEIKKPCTARSIQPVELIAVKPTKVQKISKPKIQQVEKEKEEEKRNDILIDKLDKLRDTSEFDNIVKGAKLGLTSYQKPNDGIPEKDLSKDLQEFIYNTKTFIHITENKKSLDFGQVSYDRIKNRISFYATDDVEKVNELGVVQLPRSMGNLSIDKFLNVNSDNAIANSTVTKNLEIIRDLIPDIKVQNETLKINEE